MIGGLWQQILSGSFWYPLAFLILAVGTLVPALLVVLSRSLVHSALWLLVSLMSTAGLFVLLGAEALGALQILIYCGGVIVLILFAVMLTHGAARPETGVHNRLLWWSLPVVLGFGILTFTLTRREAWPLAQMHGAADVTPRLADALLGPYVLAFEVASVILLVAMVGAIVIATAEPKQ
jgi:NADH-quinone oxidoreductase subunit J